MKNNKFIPKTEKPGILIQNGKFFIDMTFLKSYKKRDIFIHKNEQFIFKNIWQHIDIKYEKTLNQLKETISINDVNATHSLKFHIDTNLVVNNDENKGINMSSSKTDEIIFSFKNVRLWDVNGNLIKDGVKTSFDNKSKIYEIRIKKQEENKYPMRIS